MKRTTQALIEPEANMLGRAGSRQAGILAPAGMGTQVLPGEHGRKRGKGSVDDLAMGG